jgi:ribonuclease ZC3H12
VLDAQNVAMRHGQDLKFSCRGIQIAVNYWQKNGHKVICFLPDYLFDYAEVGKQKKLQDLGLKQAKAQKIPDSVQTLLQLKSEGVMVSTPSQDYDDSYCIQYAKQAAHACIVSNDKFRDYLRKLEINPTTNERLSSEKQWLKQHLVSFAFKGDEFLPNPDSHLFSKFAYASYKQDEAI